MKNKKTCGMIAIAGAPNAGKSTLVNALVGQKISIVTPKVQTTRFCIRGAFCEGNAQVVLVDTPGIFDTEQKFERSLVKEAYGGLNGSDALCILFDVAKKSVAGEIELIGALLKRHENAALVLNKVDRAKKHELLALTAEFSERFSIKNIFMISAKTGDGLKDLKSWMVSSLPQAPWLYPEDQVSDSPMRIISAEITREKLFLLLREELPYNLTVVCETWEERQSAVVIKQAIIVTKENHKKMVIGKAGATIKRVGESARRELEKMLDKKVHLTLFVKVDAKWQDKVISQGQAYEG